MAKNIFFYNKGLYITNLTKHKNNKYLKTVLYFSQFLYKTDASLRLWFLLSYEYVMEWKQIVIYLKRKT